MVGQTADSGAITCVQLACSLSCTLRSSCMSYRLTLALSGQLVIIDLGTLGGGGQQLGCSQTLT
jgi:hypothetical protein